jgi:hypothetical protein
MYFQESDHAVWIESGAQNYEKVILNQSNYSYYISTPWEGLRKKNLYFNCINIFWEITTPMLLTNYKYDRPVI